MVVENVTGAGGMTGAARVAQAPADGYEILLGTVGTQVYNQTLYKHPLYNARTDFASIALIAEQPLVLIARPDLPADTLPEFITYLQANASDMAFGSGGARFGNASGLRASQRGSQGQGPAHSLPGLGLRHAGSHRRPPRLSVRFRDDRDAADVKRMR